MNIQTKTSILYVLELTEQELADALVDPAPLQDQLRAARAAHRASVDTRTDNIAYSTRAPYRVDGKQIARAAKKQNKKVANRFLAKTGDGAFRCDRCEKSFDTRAILNRHKGRMHKAATEYLNTAPAAGDASDE